MVGEATMVQLTLRGPLNPTRSGHLFEKKRAFLVLREKILDASIGYILHNVNHLAD